VWVGFYYHHEHGCDEMIPIAKPEIGEEEIRRVTDVLRSGMLAQG
jgi:dTDP-4-amino-4,6-dideoxygalactose transaminase